MQGHDCSEEFLNNLLEGCLIVAPDWHLLFLNEAAARQLRRPRDELLGRSLRDLLPNFERSPLFASLTRCMNARESAHLSQQLTFPDGGTAFFELCIDPVETGVQILSLDVTGHRDSEQQLSRFFSLSPDLMAVAGFDGHFRQLSPSWEKVLGHPLAELTARPWLDFVHPDDHAATLAAGEQLMRGEDVELFINRYRHHDGSWRWIEWHCTPDLDHQQIFAVARDVTERRLADETTRSMALFPEENPWPVFRVSRAGTLLFANRATAPLLANWHCTIGAMTPAPVREAVAAAFAQSVQQEVEVEHAGRVISFVVVPLPERDYANLYGRDITERVHAKAALRRSLKHFELLAWSAEELLKSTEPQRLVESLCRKVMELLDCDTFFNYLFDRQSGRLHLNAAAGISGETARAIEWLEVGQAVCGWAVRDGHRIVAEYIAEGDDERTALVRSLGIRAYACHPLLEVSGVALGTLSFGTRSRDTFGDDELSLMKAVADQMAIALIRLSAEGALRDSEAHYRETLELLPQLVWTCRPDGRCDYLSRQWLDYTGRPFDQHLDYGWLEQVHPDDRRPLRKAWETAVTSGTEFQSEFRIRRHDGVYRWFMTRATPLHDSRGQIIKWFGSNTDIHDQRKALETLRDSERRLRRAEAAAHLGHWRVETGSNTIQWSDEMFRIFGVNPQHFQPSWENYQSLIHPDDLADVDQAYARIRQEGQAKFQLRIVRPEDGSLRYITGHGEIERNGRRREVAMFGTFQDVTDILQTEKELQLKNAEVERFTYMVSHDLRSPLVTIRTFLDCLEQDLANNHAVRIEKDIYFMRTATTKMARLLDELMEMTRIGRIVSHPEVVSFQELVETAQALVSGRILERDVTILIEDRPRTLFGDRSRLVEIWQNLLENAVKFMGEQPKPLVRVGIERQGRETVFFVCDNGIGIDPRFQGKIFGLFEKLEAKSEGTGLGLALVKRIVEMYGGRIWVESAGIGAGSCFRFTLPEAIRNSTKGGTA